MASPAGRGDDGDALVEAVRAAGLRGRGGGWFETARKWQAVRVEGGDPFVVANGAEGEPGSLKDRWLMRRRPHAVLQGLGLAMRAVGAREGCVYLKGSLAAEEGALSAALPEVRETAALSIEVRRGDDSYVGGEETAVLEVLEGRRAWPRPKPPLPSAVGFRGRPTLVQNVETLARVPDAVHDPAAFHAGEQTLVSLWGHVARPGVYEVALGTPLRAVIEAHGGGADVGMLFPAGPSAAPLAASQLDLPLDPAALRAAGSALGTAALLVVRASACPLAVAASLAGFFEREACGQCPPCTVGTARLAGVLRAVEAGDARARDLADLAEAAGFMAGHGYCAHGRTAAAAVTGLLKRFPDDVAAHLEARGCPRPADGCDPFAPGSPERRALEAAVFAP
jgi:NADH-quinone oxidoreductase subunit F